MFALQTQNLGHVYGKTIALQDLCLDVPKRSVFGFLGPNGAGKTTAIRCILGLIRARSGSVKINDQDLVRDRNQALQSVGSVVETPALYPNLTGRENLEITRLLIDAPKTAVDRVLELVELQEVASRKTNQYSLGMRQRLGLARAMLGSPALLVLDEPTNGLDPAGIRDMRNLIRALPQRDGTTIFMSSHLLSEIENTADHVALMKQGQLIFQGSLGALMEKREVCIHIQTDAPKQAAALAQSYGFDLLAQENDWIELQPPQETRNQKKNLSDLNMALGKAGIAVSEFRQKQADLEAIFLSLTGRSADGQSRMEDRP